MDGRRFRASGTTEPGLQADSSAVRSPWPRRSVDHRGSGHVWALRASRISAPLGFTTRRSPNRPVKRALNRGSTPSGPRHAYETGARAADREPGLDRPGEGPGVGSASGHARSATPDGVAVGGSSCCEIVRPLLGMTCANRGCPPSGRRWRRGTATGPRADLLGRAVRVRQGRAHRDGPAPKGRSRRPVDGRRGRGRDRGAHRRGRLGSRQPAPFAQAHRRGRKEPARLVPGVRTRTVGYGEARPVAPDTRTARTIRRDGAKNPR